MLFEYATDLARRGCVCQRMSGRITNAIYHTISQSVTPVLFSSVYITHALLVSS